MRDIRLRLLYVLLGITLSVPMSLFVFSVMDTARFFRESEKISNLFSRFETSRPPDVSAAVWVEAWGWTQTAINNVCFSEQYIDADSLVAFRKAIEQKANGTIGIETLHWIWEELKRIKPTGQYGDGYVERYKPQFLEAINRNKESNVRNSEENDQDK